MDYQLLQIDTFLLHWESTMLDKLFSEKIKYLHLKLGLTEKEFTKLFWDGEQKKFATRHTTVHESWLGRGIKQVKGFYFDTYPISKWILDNGEFAFTKTSFMVDSFENFKIRVDRYVEHISKPKELFEYKYIYYYDANRNQTSYYELSKVERVNSNEYRVEILPFKFYQEREVLAYNGTLKIDRDYYHISIENSFEILTFYFMLGRGFKNGCKINGIGLGLSYAKGLPRSSKALFTKGKLTKEEKLEFYLNANESEFIMVDENLDDLYLDAKTNYLNKFHHKLDNLATFMKKSKEKVLYDELADDIYFDVFYQSFMSLNEISKKIKGGHHYFINRRRMATEIFLKSIGNNHKNSCRIVYPLIKSDATLFDENDKRSEKVLKLHLTLLKNGHAIERIFIINKNYQFTEYVKKSINILVEQGMIAKIAFVEDIDLLDISSYDFVYSRDINGAIYRNTRDKVCFFKVTKLKERVKQLTYDFEKIEKVSCNYDEFLSKKDLKNDDVLEQLVGTWHLYFYSSIEENNHHILWHNIIEIEQDSSLKYYHNNELLLQGHIDTSFNKEKVICLLNHLKIGVLSILTFKKRHIHKNIFKINISDSQLVNDYYDMASFGIFSKSKLDEALVKKALGTADEVMLRENIELEKRINQLYIESRF